MTHPDVQPSITVPPRPRSQRKKVWLPLLGGLLLLGGLGLSWQWWQSNRSQDEPAAAAPTATVKLITLQPATVRESSEFVGNLDSRRAVELRPEVEGRVSQIFVQPGDRVAAGTRLISINPDVRQAEVASAQSNVIAARAARNSALQELQALEAERGQAQAEVDLQNAEYQRQVYLFREGAVSQSDLDIQQRDRRTAIATLRAISQRIEAARASLAEASAQYTQAQAQAQAAQAQLQNQTVNAPFAGTVGDIPIKQGEYVSSSDTLGTLTQDNKLELRLAVPLERSSELRLGLPVQLTSPQGELLTSGQISFIEPQVQPNAQTILAKAQFDNPSGRLRDNQFVRARLIWRQERGILVPTTAVSRLAGQAFVFVAKSQQVDGKTRLIAEQRPVKLGSLQGNNYQVVSGLKPGEQIVTAGILNLADGAPINPQQ